MDMEIIEINELMKMLEAFFKFNPCGRHLFM